MAENTIMIQPERLIDLFREAVNDQWGYIYGETHRMWTEALQKKYVEQYNSDPVKWKDHETSAKLGSKWVGHWVTDCSGIFAWAFKELGGSIAHGSNSMWKKYSIAKGALSQGSRTDGQELKPGTAVFTGNESNHGYVGLYVGNGEVIEASGTKVGVICSSISLDKWTSWAELKGVQYDGDGEEEGQPVPVTPEKGSAYVNATRVALRIGPSTSATVLQRVDKGQTVKIADKPEDWEYVEYNGRKGYMMKKFLVEG